MATRAPLNVIVPVVAVRVTVVALTAKSNVVPPELVMVNVVTPLTAPVTPIVPLAPASKVRAVLLLPSPIVEVKVILSPDPPPEVMVVVTAPASRSTEPVNVTAPVVLVYVVPFRSILVPVTAIAPVAVTSGKST